MKYLKGNRYSLKNLVKIKSRKSFWSVLFFLYSGYFAADIYLFKATMETPEQCLNVAQS